MVVLAVREIFFFPIEAVAIHNIVYEAALKVLR